MNVNHLNVWHVTTENVLREIVGTIELADR